MQLALAPLAEAFFTRYLIAHTGHHLVHGPTRFADHEFLGTLYHTYNDAFDTVLELAVLRGEKFSHPEVIANALTVFTQLNGHFKLDTGNSAPLFTLLTAQERDLRTLIDDILAQKPDTALRTTLEQLAADSLDRSKHLTARIS